MNYSAAKQNFMKACLSSLVTLAVSSSALVASHSPVVAEPLDIDISDPKAIAEQVKEIWDEINNCCKILVEVENETNNIFTLHRKSDVTLFSAASGTYIDPPSQNIIANSVEVFASEGKSPSLSGNSGFVIYRIESLQQDLLIAWHSPLIGYSHEFVNLWKVVDGKSTLDHMSDATIMFLAFPDDRFVSSFKKGKVYSALPEAVLKGNQKVYSLPISTKNRMYNLDVSLGKESKVVLKHRGFKYSCFSSKLDAKDLMLEATCEGSSASINLEKYIANINGELKWSDNGNGEFQKTCKNIAYTQSSTTLSATCDNINRTNTISTNIDLSDGISYVNGQLKYLNPSQ